MGKGPKGSFFASDDKAENHINEREGKKNSKSEENESKGRRLKRTTSVQDFSSHFSKAKSVGQGWTREKNMVYTISFRIGYFFSNVFKNPARSGTLKPQLSTVAHMSNKSETDRQRILTKLCYSLPLGLFLNDLK